MFQIMVLWIRNMLSCGYAGCPSSFVDPSKISLSDHNPDFNFFCVDLNLNIPMYRCDNVRLFSLFYQRPINFSYIWGLNLVFPRDFESSEAKF